ncbi:MAG TPA: NADH-quinone oxidoreductase subunit C [Phnomibacter sp.]|nr:NADH-quinone oxidoreductase subunit C [Phnomibacter sp.]
MNKIETTIPALKDDIRRFYDPEKHHFMVINAVESGQKMEVQWFFCDYAPPCSTTTFFTVIEPSTEVPSIRDIVESAWVAEAELVDLMNIKIEDTDNGFVLEPDSQSGPLLKKK